MWPDNPIFVFSGPNRLPAGGEERPGELEERPCEEDQNAGVRAEAREVSALPPTAASAHPQHTQIPQLVCTNCSVSMFSTLLKIYSCLWEVGKRRTWPREIPTGQQIDVCCTCTEQAHSRVRLSARLHSSFSNVQKGCKRFKGISSILLFIFYAYQSDVSAGVSRSSNRVRVPERFPPSPAGVMSLDESMCWHEGFVCCRMLMTLHRPR